MNLGAIVDTTDRENEWQKEYDFETLVKASVIINDEKRLQGARDFAEQQKKALDEVLDKDFLKKIGLKK